LGRESGPGQLADRGFQMTNEHIIIITIERVHVKIESRSEVASWGPTWRNATPLV
jgi:hypothetical protein